MVADYRADNKTYAAVTFALVFVPSFFFSLYMFVYSFRDNSGCLACCKAVTWMMLFPVMPLWPIIRALIQMGRAMVTVCGSQDKRHERKNTLAKSSSSHLLKFLQAFTASAPQLVVRLHKVAAMDPDRPFASITVAETVQVAVALFALSMAVVSTYNKSVNTSGVRKGRLSLHKLSCGASLLALVWWFTFLAARIPCIALFIHVFEYWSGVLLLLHCVLIFALQTNVKPRHVLEHIVVYLFSGFVFIFAYLQLNLLSRNRSYWLPYALFTLLALLEQSAMLTFWVLVKRSIIPYYPMIPDSMFSIHSNDTTSVPLYTTDAAYEFQSNLTTTDPGPYFGVLDHDLFLVSIHFGIFLISIIFMTTTLCCVRRDDDEDDYDDSYSSY